ncbi:rcc01693 family protein [Poseidonocella sp. HB161398]|uniref:rcc01693 family protein n=1 Tax=Poseidonocella sp. HB161398 TaxID=2320855 RepID=UPI0011091E79|nr:rcc01693 family protein [Poseidonocella sp. HB161398]
MSGLDWPGLMRAGLGELRLTPREFWALTPAELEMMLGRDRRTGALGRAGLEELVRRFPDVSKETGDG